MVSDAADVIIALKSCGFYVLAGNGNTAVDGLATASCPETEASAKVEALKSACPPKHYNAKDGKWERFQPCAGKAE